MLKKSILAVVAIFILWQATDYLVHGVFLKGFYEQPAELWRPLPEMKVGIMAVISLLTSVMFVSIYTLFFKKWNVKVALQYGVISGVGAGAVMGYSAYTAIPIPYYTALSWFC